MAKKKDQVKKTMRDAMRDSYKQLLKNRKFDNPFDEQDTNDAAGKSIEDFIKEHKRRQFFNNPQSPRA